MSGRPRGVRSARSAAGGGPVRLRGEPGERRERDDQRQRLGLRQREHRRRRGEHRERDRVPAAEAVGQVPADERGADAAEAVGAHGEARLRRRVPLVLEVQDEEDDHEAPEPVDERAGEQEPRGRRQLAQALTERHRPTLENPADAAHGLGALLLPAGRVVAPGALALALAGGARRPRHARRRLGRGSRRAQPRADVLRGDRRRAGRLHAGPRACRSSRRTRTVPTRPIPSSRSSRTRPTSGSVDVWSRRARARRGRRRRRAPSAPPDADPRGGACGGSRTCRS